MTETRKIFGLDLSYSVNKKSYNIIDSLSFADFCTNELNMSAGAESVTKLISFGNDRYGVIDKSVIRGFIFNKNKYEVLNESVAAALSKIESLEGLIFSDTASGSEIVIFDNNNSQFRNIDLLDKHEKEQIKEENKYAAYIKEEKEEAKGAEHKEEVKDKGEAKEEGKDSKKEVKNKQRSPPKFKVKSSIKNVFKHLLLTANGSLYGLQKSFHKKYVNNQRVVSVKCDGNRCTLCLDENGVLWSFGINLFGKLGLKRNDKKQIYTNPREISIFKAYKVSDFGITNRCCIAVCANGSIYGWGSYNQSRDSASTGDIWYTPNLITADDDKNTSYDSRKKKEKYQVYAGYRFILLLNTTTNKLYLINTEFGYTLIAKPRNGLIIQTQSIAFDNDLVIKGVIPSNESAMIVCKQ